VKRITLIFIASLLAVTLNSALVHGAVLCVQPTGELQSLRAALLKANDNDTILVASGTYCEWNLIAAKSVTILGEDWPTIDASEKGPILEVTAPNVHISGITFCNVPVSHIKEHAAILVSSTQECEISNNRFRGNFFAIYLANSQRCQIVDNEVRGTSTDLTSSGNAIHLWKSRDITITGNILRGHRDGIYLEFVKHSLITNNQSEQNLRYGLHFMFSDSCRYEQNRFLGNGSGVAVMYTTSVDMSDNTFSDSWGGAAYGLLLKDIKDSRVANNLFSGNSVAINMEGSDRVRIDSNMFVANGWAIKIMANCVGGQIRNNSFIDNTFQVATNSRQTFSTFEANYWSAYRGFDLDRDGFGDEPFRPVSLYSLLVESEPPTLILVRSLLVDLLDLAERVMPTLTPEALVDAKPRMRPVI
jgi:nitrous oxidase accessory protein